MTNTMKPLNSCLAMVAVVAAGCTVSPEDCFYNRIGGGLDHLCQGAILAGKGRGFTGEGCTWRCSLLGADRELVVRNDGLALGWADESLQADREVVLEAVKEWGGALEYAAEELRNDPELKRIAER